MRTRGSPGEECEREVTERRRAQTHRSLGQTQNAAVLNVQAVLERTNKQGKTGGKLVKRKSERGLVENFHRGP